MSSSRSSSQTYDKNSIASIYEFALRLKNRSLADVVTLPAGVTNVRDRGNLGSLVETYYFQHKPPNDHNPDFVEVGLELKTSGVVKGKNGEFRAKERLVLTMIDFNTLAKEEWVTSSFLHKCQRMLILFNKFEKDIPVINRKFVMDPLLFGIGDPEAEHPQVKGFENIPKGELETLKRDWIFIRQKVLDGKAHELSEGDTFYLGACRKGAGGPKEALRTQPFSEVGAKARAFSLKQNYVNRLIERHVNQIHESGIFETLSIDEATHETFRNFIGKSTDELAAEFNYFKKSKNQKGYLRSLALKILATAGTGTSQLNEADIEMKTIRLKVNGSPRESMSFPTFDYMKIGTENWEDSSFFEKIERKFLLVIFQEDKEGLESLIAAEYWNMPYEDRLEAKRVWEETKWRVGIDASKLPTSRESRVAHVRPKAANGKDKALSPQGQMLVKKCFWLNKKYIESVMESIVS